MSDRLSIIVYSCWKNRDMWEIFSKLFQRYWKNCPYQVILVTDVWHEQDKQYVFTKVVQIDDTWARMVKGAVSQAQTPYVSLWMDDYLLCDYVQDADIEKQLERAIRYHAANIRLTESPLCHGRWEGRRNIGYYKRGKAYSLSTQIGIWDSRFLFRTIKNEWSAWDFERIASLDKADDKQPILVALDYEFPYEESVRKGKWMQQGVRLLRRNGIKPDMKVRPVMTNMEMAKIYFQGAALEWNATFVVSVQNLLARIRG